MNLAGKKFIAGRTGKVGPLMLLVNFSGGPGSGKSTTAAFVFARLKMDGYRAELVGEEARELVYDSEPGGAIPILDNQILILGQQFQRIKRLENHGADVAICDSPLSLSVLYSKDKPYSFELTALVRRVERLFPDTLNVFVQRVKPYVKFGRYQNEEQAKALDQDAQSLLAPVHLTVTGDEAGAIQAVAAITRRLKEKS